MKRTVWIFIILLVGLTYSKAHADPPPTGTTPSNVGYLGNMDALIKAIKGLSVQLSTAAGPAGPAGPAGSGGGTVTESTATLTLFGGGVFLSTFNPIGSATFRVSKSSFYVTGVDAFVNKPSSVGATHFKVYYSTSDRYGITWTPITFSVIVDTNLRQSVYTSTAFNLYEGYWVGVGIDTLAISGLQAEDWGVNLHGVMRRQGQQW